MKNDNIIMLIFLLIKSYNLCLSVKYSEHEFGVVQGTLYHSTNHTCSELKFIFEQHPICFHFHVDRRTKRKIL